MFDLSSDNFWGEGEEFNEEQIRDEIKKAKVGIVEHFGLVLGKYGMILMPKIDPMSIDELAYFARYKAAKEFVSQAALDAYPQLPERLHSYIDELKEWIGIRRA